MDYDAELHLHAEVLRRACAIGGTERVLDIGCGTGQTTRDAARATVEARLAGPQYLIEIAAIAAIG